MDLMTLGLIGAAGAGGYLLYKNGLPGTHPASPASPSGGVQIGGSGGVNVSDQTLNNLGSGLGSFISGWFNIGKGTPTSVGGSQTPYVPPPPPPPFYGGDPAAGSGSGYAGANPGDWSLPDFGGTTLPADDGSGAFTDPNFDYNA